MLTLTAVPEQVQEPAWNGDRPPLEWLTIANRHTLVTRLLSATVHDVNNSLQVMSGAAEVLAMDPTTASVIKRTDSIVGQARQATVTLHALTEFARGSAPAVGNARPKALAEKAVALRQYALLKARIAVTVSGDECPCPAAPGRVLQVVLNFLANAEQALAGRTGATVAVRVASDGAHVTIAVADNGPGLADDHDLTFRAWPPARAATGHLGIGLLVSQGLAERDGGAVSYAPTPGGGATFLLTLPR